MGDNAAPKPWDGDLLGYAAIGDTYTNLIQSIDDSKVISIEAGFGRGKTFFRKEWAKHLRAAGEVVIEIDAQLSDHSGDPVVTFIGALVADLPDTEKGKVQAFWEKGKKFGGAVGRTVAKAALKSGADELIDGLTDTAADAVEGMDALEAAVAEIGDGMSKLAGQAIAAQMAAEQMRVKEMPQQLDALRKALTEEKDTDRVVILIDELDRCHPDYVIALLEAMKLVFDQDGFVFCLMVNADYLERLATHRFGGVGEGERYLDKFVDIRLQLPRADEFRGVVAADIVRNLQVENSFGTGREFTTEYAAEVAQNIVSQHDFSMRQIERVLLKVDVALRCYRQVPIDLPLLVFLAFVELKSPGLSPENFLPRAGLTREFGQTIERMNNEAADGYGTEQEMTDMINQLGRELLTLPRERYQLDGNGYPFDWDKAISLSKYYIPRHEAILNGIYRLVD